jgi:hypothetical protein
MMGIINDSPGILEYIQIAGFMIFIYWWEKSSRCSKKNEGEYEHMQLLNDGLWTCVIPMIIYIGYYTFFKLIPLIGPIISMINHLPIINHIVGGGLLYIIYNILRNYRELKNKNKCKL